MVYAVLGSDISITGLEGAADPAVDLLKEIEGYVCNDCNRLHEKPFCLIFTEELQCATGQPQRRQLGMARYGSCHTLALGENVNFCFF